MKKQIFFLLFLSIILRGQYSREEYDFNYRRYESSQNIISDGFNSVKPASVSSALDIWRFHGLKKHAKSSTIIMGKKYKVKTLVGTGLPGGATEYYCEITCDENTYRFHFIAPLHFLPAAIDTEYYSQQLIDSMLVKNIATINENATGMNMASRKSKRKYNHSKTQYLQPPGVIPVQKKDNLNSLKRAKQTRIFQSHIGEIQVRGNYPNPFNGKTKILIESDKKGRIALSIYNTNGQLMMSKNEYFINEGINEIILENLDIASGTYFYFLSFEGQNFVNRMTLLK